MKFGTMHLQSSKILFPAVVKQNSSSCGKKPWGLRRPWVERIPIFVRFSQLIGLAREAWLGDITSGGFSCSPPPSQSYLVHFQLGLYSPFPHVSILSSRFNSFKSSEQCSDQKVSLGISLTSILAICVTKTYAGTGIFLSVFRSLYTSCFMSVQLAATQRRKWEFIFCR